MTVAEILRSVSDYIDADNADVELIDIYCSSYEMTDEIFERNKDVRASSFEVELPENEDADVAKITILLRGELK